MKQFTYTITDPTGIHARPAGLLITLAKKFSSDVTFSCNGKTAGKRLIALMSLGVKQGQPLSVSIEGADEDEAEKQISAFLKEHL